MPLYTDEQIKSELSRKKRLHNADRFFAEKDREKFKTKVAEAREMAGTDVRLLKIIHYIDVLQFLGVHPTYAAQAAAASLYHDAHDHPEEVP
jgi:hypothetical protein